MTDFASAVKWDLLPFINGEGLDVGCGDFRPWDWLVGVDIKPGTTGRGPNQIRDARKLDGYFAAESQDFVFSSYLLNELDDWPAVLAGWWKLVKQNGYLILFLPIVEAVEAKDGQPEIKALTPKLVIDAMQGCKPWQLVEASINDKQFFHVYRKCDAPTVTEKPDPEKVCAVLKLGAHGDALWASSVFPHLKEQGYYTVLYTQDTGEEVLRHDPNIDRLIKFESRVPMGELGDLFHWMETKYRNSRILVECVEGTLLPSPNKIQYHFPYDLRHKIMNFNYLEMHHMQARVPMEPRVMFYPTGEEKAWANETRSKLKPCVVVMVPNGSSITKWWPYAGELASRLLRRDDVSVVVLGDLRDCEFQEHPDLMRVGLGWPVRRAMTFCQLANVVVGQETGLLNCVSFEQDVRKVVLMTHSSKENLTRDWPNTATMVGKTDCGPCHRLQYNWEYCTQSPVTKAAACQTGISVSSVLREVEVAIPSVSRIAIPTESEIENLQRLHVA